MSEIDHKETVRYAEDCKTHGGPVGIFSRAYLDLHAQLAAERARVVALVDVIHDANGIAYPFKEMQDKMTAILNAHAQGDVG